MIGETLGPYRILDKLGAGGMGEVYRARDTRLDRVVAIKVLVAHAADDPAFRERFDREARVISQLSHPHICTLHDVGEENGTRYLVLEYLEGETLAERLTRGALTIESALAIGIQICAGLDKAHRHGIVHRDLKPGNVMLVGKTATLHVKLLDFGLAKPATAAVAVSPGNVPAITVSTPLTAEGMLLGTLQYMAPEQVEGKEADARSDIFAMGAVLHEMVTGVRAFEGKSAASVIAAILERQPPPLSSLRKLTPPTLDHVVDRCLAKDPDERWQSAGDVMRELRWVASAARGVRVPAVRRGWSAAWVASTIALAAALTGTVVWNARETPDSPEPVQFSLLPPPGTRWSSDASISVSPDGRQLAFVAWTGPLESRRLWIYSFATGETRELPGTDGATRPFWSPDSRHIAYFRGYFSDGPVRQLMRIDRSGGAAQAICDVMNGPPWGTWNRDGVILFGTVEGLHRVAADGGRSERITRVDPEKENAHFGPQFLPDGRHFIYVRGGRREADDDGRLEEWDLYAASLDAPEGRRIGTVGSVAVVASSGHVFFMRGRTLVVQPFDVNRLELSGTAVKIAEEIDLNRNYLSGAFNVSDTGALVYRTGERANSELVWVDRAGAVLSTLGPPGIYKDPALSVDGRFVAYTRLEDSSAMPDVWMMNLLRPAPTRLTFGQQADAVPIWSPDGARLVYAANRGGGRYLYVKSMVDDTERELWRDTAPLNPSDWSPDGKVILFDRRSNRQLDTMQLVLDGEARAAPFLQNPKFNEWLAVFSPDGRWVAYDSNESGERNVYVRSFAGQGRPERISPDGGTEPRWRRDGKELFYRAPDGRLMAVEVQTGASFSARPPRALFNTNAVDEPASVYNVAADGQRFLMVRSRAAADARPITVVLNWAGLLRR